MFLESSFGKLGVSENFGKQATPDVFAGMDWHDSSATVRMLQVVMTAPDADNLKAKPLQGHNELAARNAWQPAHSATLTR